MSSPSSSLSLEMFPSNIDRFDFAIPNQKIFSIPLRNDITGSDIISIVNKFEIKSYVICCLLPSSDFYSLFYTDEPNYIIDSKSNILLSSLIKLTNPFTETKLTELFIINRSISTSNQRLVLNLFYIEDFMKRYTLNQIKFKTSSLFPKSKDQMILVQLPTKLNMKIKVRTDKKIYNVKTKLYQKMTELYGEENMGNMKNYKFGTIDCIFPSSKVIFNESKPLMQALKLQKKNPSIPQFIFTQDNKFDLFDTAAKEYTEKLDLSSISDTDQNKVLNGSLSVVRRQVEDLRIKVLQENPLFARMRISKTDPSLEKLKNESVTIFMKAELRSVLGISSLTTGLSIRIQSKQTAKDAISEFLKKVDSKINFEKEPGDSISRYNSSGFLDTPDLSPLSKESPKIPPPSTSPPPPPKKKVSSADLPSTAPSTSPSRIQITPQLPSTRKGSHLKTLQPSAAPPTVLPVVDLDPNNYVLVLKGTDEVLAGDTPLEHFYYVRQFLLSNARFLQVLLESKDNIIKSIKSKEMSTSIKTEEPNSDALFKPIMPKVPENLNEKDFTDSSIGYIPHTLIKEPLRVYIGSAINIPTTKSLHKYFLNVSLINGTDILCPSASSKVVVGGNVLFFNQVLVLNIPICNIPRTARLSFTVYNIDKKKKKKGKGDVSTYNFPLFTYNGWMNLGHFVRMMWLDHDRDFFLSTCESNEEDAVQLDFSLPRFCYPVAFIQPEPVIKKIEPGETLSPKLDAEIQRLQECDPLYELTDADSELLWKNREYLISRPLLLPQMLSSIDYSQPDQVNQIPNLLANWEKLNPTDALTLLDAKFADHRIREYAVSCLEQFSDSDMMLYMLQMVQALKYELYDDSALARFLIKRGLSEPKFVGHQLFWQLISEAHLSHIRQRFSSILVNFMYGIGSYRNELLTGYEFTQNLVKLNQKLCALKYNEATIQFQKELTNFEIPKEFHLPIDPRLIVDKFIPSKCKVMNSKKKPFFLTFHNAAPFAKNENDKNDDNDLIQMMFKVGDDLRQDQLTLQIMKVMDHLWKDQGYDYRMNCYGVLPTGFNQGFIEVVRHAKTEAALQQEKGTFSGVFDRETFSRFLKEHNQNPIDYNVAKENFMWSSAGYAVATCVLGIADRHPGNIMVQEDGHFFHIDFGHFLGNFKTKLGYQRENAPFHFSLAAAYVCGYSEKSEKNEKGEKMIEQSEEFKKFQTESGIAFNILRNNSRLLITLLVLMIGTGIPELQKLSDMDYMKNMLNLDLSDEEAAKKFIKLIKVSLESTKTLLNNLFHNIKTG